MAVQIISITSMIVLLAPTLEGYMANVAICWGDYYPGLLVCDMLCRYNEALSLETIALPRPN